MLKNFVQTAAFLLLIPILTGCGKKNLPTEDLPQISDLKAGEQIATISTSMGDIKLRFFPEYAPKAVENFITHAKEGYYDNTIFHRVINNFMIQGGDPLGNGTGGESIWGKEFENEVSNNLFHLRGALSMANAGPDTNGSQFFIVQNPKLDPDQDLSDKPKQIQTYYQENGGCPFLDGGYSVFGQVIEGMDIVDKIAAVQTDYKDKPLTDIKINNITVEEYTPDKK